MTKFLFHDELEQKETENFMKSFLQNHLEQSECDDFMINFLLGDQLQQN